MFSLFTKPIFLEWNVYKERVDFANSFFSQQRQFIDSMDEEPSVEVYT